MCRHARMIQGAGDASPRAVHCVATACPVTWTPVQHGDLGLHTLQVQGAEVVDGSRVGPHICRSTSGRGRRPRTPASPSLAGRVARPPKAPHLSCPVSTRPPPSASAVAACHGIVEQAEPSTGIGEHHPACRSFRACPPVPVDAARPRPCSHLLSSATLSAGATNAPLLHFTPSFFHRL